jgi:hypothetical protein
MAGRMDQWKYYLRAAKEMGKTETAHLNSPVKGCTESTADLDRDGVAEIGVGLRHLLADVFALYMKTKNFTGT